MLILFVDMKYEKYTCTRTRGTRIKDVYNITAKFIIISKNKIKINNGE